MKGAKLALSGFALVAAVSCNGGDNEGKKSGATPVVPDNLPGQVDKPLTRETAGPDSPERRPAEATAAAAPPRPPETEATTDGVRSDIAACLPQDGPESVDDPPREFPMGVEELEDGRVKVHLDRVDVEAFGIHWDALMQALGEAFNGSLTKTDKEFWADGRVQCEEPAGENDLNGDCCRETAPEEGYEDWVGICVYDRLDAGLRITIAGKRRDRGLGETTIQNGVLRIERIPGTKHTNKITIKIGPNGENEFVVDIVEPGGVVDGICEPGRIVLKATSKGAMVSDADIDTSSLTSTNDIGGTVTPVGLADVIDGPSDASSANSSDGPYTKHMAEGDVIEIDPLQTVAEQFGSKAVEIVGEAVEEIMSCDASASAPNSSRGTAILFIFAAMMAARARKRGKPQPK